ncbi:MAG: putative sulfate exporter family transporter [Nocardioides sp.]|uniref:YeiH family protein n=1 Tax=Nocardioides sp. TaxID=35761 RepID=UPI0039E68A12
MTAIKTVTPDRVVRIAPPLLAAVVALAISTWIPLLGPLLIALLLGATVANISFVADRLPAGQEHVAKLMLRLGVVLLGLRLPFGDVLRIGLPGLAIILATVFVTYSVTKTVGKRMALDPRFVTLLAAGFSICGAAAIAAIDDAVSAREKDVALAVAMVTLFGSAMIALVPWFSGPLNLTNDQAAVWAGASIHEVAQVVAAASLLGGGALAVATTVKLGRVMLLAPVYAIAARGARREDGTRMPLVPWFVIAFVAAVALRSTGLLPGTALDLASQATTLLLAAGMFGLGVGFMIKDMWPLPWAAFGLATFSTLVAGGVSLALVLTLI